MTDMTKKPDGQWQIIMDRTNNRRSTLILDENFKLLEVTGDGAPKKVVR